MTAVTLKYMTNPVTSTSLATNGSEDEGGSKPSRRKSSGAVHSVYAPHTSMTTSVTLTLMATDCQRSP
jgi:hypothetical protein